MSFVSCGFWGTRRRLHVAILADGHRSALACLRPTRPVLEDLLDHLAEQQATLVLPAALPWRPLLLELARTRTLHVMLAPDALITALRTVAGLESAPLHLSAALVARLARLPLFLEHLDAVPNRHRRYWGW